jgi:signal transduction histidine kinase
MKALPLFEKLGDKASQLLVMGNISNIHACLHDYDKAIYYREQELAMAKVLNDVEIMCDIYYNIGSCYINKEEHKKSLEYVLKALEIADSIKDPLINPLATIALAIIYSDGFEDYNKAEKYAKEGLRLAEESEMQNIIINAKSQLSAIYLVQERYQECDILASMSYEMDTTDIANGLSITENIILANIFLGNKDKAVSFFQKHRSYVERKTVETLHRSIAEMEVQYETEKKELRIAEMEKEKVFYIWLGIVGGILLLSLLILFIILHRLAVSKRKLAEQQTIIAEQQIKQMEQKQQIVAAQLVMDGETAERTRLARDLHDGLGGMLSVVKLNLTDLEHLEKARELLDQSINELRRVAHHLMPESLLRYGLKTALDDFCKSVPNLKFHYFGNESHLDDRIEVLIYRCAHELVNNAIKYANASTINVQLVQDPDLISLTVEDDGCGFDTETVGSGMGLENLRTRVAAYNGKINFFSSPGKGTEVSVELALQQSTKSAVNVP